MVSIGKYFMAGAPKDQRSDTEAERVRDDALRRALSMPPQPKRAKPKKARTTKKARKK